MGESEGVGRNVDFGDDVDILLFGLHLKVDELALSVAAVLGGETGEEAAFEAEGRLRLVPIVVEVLLEAVVVEVDVEGVHLVVGHHADELVEIVHGDELAAAVNHKSAQGVGGDVGSGAAG